MAKGRGKPCGASWIAKSKVCRVNLPSAVNAALNRASDEVGIVELINAAKHVGGRGAMGKAIAIRQQLRQEMAGDGNLRKGAHGVELKRRLEAAGLLPKKEAAALTKSVVLDDIKSILKGTSREKSQIAQLQSVLGLGTQTRKEIGRDYSGLLEEARVLRDMKRSEHARAYKQEQELIQAGKMAEAKKMSEQGRRAASIYRAADAAINFAPVSGGTRYAREDARDFDIDLPATRRVGDDKFKGWNDSYKDGAKVLGTGSFGTAIRGSNNIVIKRGDVANTEADILKKVGKADLGPKLIAADINGPGINKDTGIDIRRGRIAMELVPGKELGNGGPEKFLQGNVRRADAFWKARAELHRLGVAHNDMHVENVLVDNKGKGRFVDMGLAQDSPKAALAEALGIFPWRTIGNTSPTFQANSRGQGDWQTLRWYGTGGSLLEAVNNREGSEKKVAKIELDRRAPLLGKVYDNRDKAIAKLKATGLSDADVAAIVNHGIRSPIESYNVGVWAKIDDKQAQSIIDALYEGI